MAAYILFGIEAKHLLTAVIMTAPGTLMMAKMFVPETEVPKTMGTVKLEVERTDVNVIDAAGRGTGEGPAPGAERRRDADFVPRADRAGQRAASASSHLSLQQIFGWVFAPVAWAWACRGTTRRRSATCSARAWRSTSSSPTRSSARSRRRSIRSRSRSRPSRCAASPTSARSASRSAASARWRPNRRHDLARLGLRAMLAGTLANFMTATIAGFLL